MAPKHANTTATQAILSTNLLTRIVWLATSLASLAGMAAILTIVNRASLVHPLTPISGWNLRNALIRRQNAQLAATNTQSKNVRAVLKNVFHAIALMTALLAILSQRHHFDKAVNASTNACPAEPQSSSTATMSANSVIRHVWNAKKGNQRIAKLVGLIKLCSCLVAHALPHALPELPKISQR